jgi:hypothetical protein
MTLTPSSLTIGLIWGPEARLAFTYNCITYLESILKTVSRKKEHSFASGVGFPVRHQNCLLPFQDPF